jgi:uncharacterized protein YdeI (YjbR/CyaY-like superfamily)
VPVKKNPGVDKFLREAKQWQKEFRKLRAIVLNRGLTEEVKWGQPCYTVGGKNVVIIHGFKEYCAILFLKGALLKDPRGVLIRQTQNVQAGRQIRFSGVRDIAGMEPILKAYIDEAIAVEKAGMKVSLKKTTDYAMPDEFRRKLDTLPRLKSAFNSLTPGRQRAYLFYFSSAKQSATRAARVEKNMKRILSGKGLDDA